MLVKMKTSVNLVISWKGTAARLMCVLVGSPGHLVGRPHFEMCVTSLQVRVKSHGVLFVSCLCEKVRNKVSFCWFVLND